MELPSSSLAAPFHQLPQQHLKRDEEAHPILLDSPLLLSLSVCARRMTKIFKRGMITEGYCWKSVPDHQKEIYWERWKAIVRAAYNAKACVRYGALMHELRALGVRPNFVTDEVWNRYHDYWASADFRARSEKASHNRKNEKGGPSTGPSKHTGGTRSFRTYEDILALYKDEDDEVTPNDVFLHVHTKDHDGVTFIDSRSAQFHATPNQSIDEEQLYYDAAGVYPKGHVYGLRSLVKKKKRYADPGASTSQESMVRHSEFDAVVQRLTQFEAFVQSQLGMRMDFGANTSQAPPPPPPQEHHYTPKELFEGAAGRRRRPTADMAQRKSTVCRQEVDGEPTRGQCQSNAVASATPFAHVDRGKMSSGATSGDETTNRIDEAIGAELEETTTPQRQETDGASENVERSKAEEEEDQKRSVVCEGNLVNLNVFDQARGGVQLVMEDG
ncbi:hypothetical protein Scep_022329 [Stephania cephalantha]|uniref:Uncharacterized protein n=1 Tax=Stephania cephalantha TaxID=152367 RepID=A0AAP0F7R4_9MAGN